MHQHARSAAAGTLSVPAILSSQAWPAHNWGLSSESPQQAPVYHPISRCGSTPGSAGAEMYRA